MSCECCEEPAIYKCASCGKLLCSEHLHFRVICASHQKKRELKYTVKKPYSDEPQRKIRELVTRFWGEETQLTFGRKFTVTKLPTYLAELVSEPQIEPIYTDGSSPSESNTDDKIAGFISFANVADDMIIVALAVLPQWQNAGIGRRLVESVEAEARKAGKKRLLVSTSNDDLPALAFYQALGFQVFEVKPNVIAKKHGRILKGIDGLPVRDELRLQKTLNNH